MYFLTNKEGYIVAASNDFLSTIGTREVCSISSMLHNQLIVIEDDKLEIPNKSLKYNCSISHMYSAFGELKLYSLKEIKEEDESIAYLKQIKSGKIIKEDNEYAIPDIPILHKTKDEQENKEEPTLKIETPKQEEDTLNQVSIKEPKLQEEDTTPSKESITTQTTEETTNENINKELELKSNNTEDTNKNIETSIEEEIKLEEPTNDINIQEQKEEPIQTKQDDKDTTSSPYNIKLIEEIEKIAVSTPTLPQEQESEISKESIDKLADEIVKEQESKEETISIFGNIEKNQSTIEEKEDITTKETQKEKTDTIQKVEESLKDKESLEKTEEIKENLIEIEPTTQKEEPKEELSGFKKITRKLFPWGKKDKDIELEDKDYEIDIKPANELQEQQVPKETTKIVENEEIVTIKEEATEQEENLEHIIDKDKTKVEEEKEEIVTVQEPKEEIKEIIEKQKDTTNKDIIQESIKQQQEPKKEESLQEESLEETETLKEQDKEDNSKIVYKLIGLQVDAIDLQANANKLSIDFSSYKMLVDNYLDEIQKYQDDLLNKTNSTINMLADAGELLSLDLITKKLNELKEDKDTKSSLKEIALISTLLKEKLEQKEQSQNVEEEKQESELPVIQNEEETTAKEELSVPKEAIDITDADTLLNKITKESVKFDPQRAADELNLPHRLIIEFVHDFVSQSKEHLPMIVEAYKSNDIQTIQTTAHMLKGAASNLRLDSIAENLFKIQKENSIERSGELIKDFIAKLKGLEEAIASMEDAEDEN